MWERTAMIGSGLTLVLLVLTAIGYVSRRDAASHAWAPADLHDMARIADAAGLYHRSDESRGDVTIRLIISDDPVGFERANLLRFGDADHPCWVNTVAACTPTSDYLAYRDEEHGIVWGRVFLFGDPTLIRKLMAVAPPGDY